MKAKHWGLGILAALFIGAPALALAVSLGLFVLLLLAFLVLIAAAWVR